MTYHANLIRASNAPDRYYRRNARALPPVQPPLPPQGPPRVPPPPPPAPAPPLNVHPRPQQGHILNGLDKDSFVLASLADGAMLEQGVRRLSPETIPTLYESRRRAKRRRTDEIISSVYFDKYSVGFDWLYGGWLAEKRINSTGGYLWLYYDPLGRQYRSKKKVIRFCQEQDGYLRRNG